MDKRSIDEENTDLNNTKDSSWRCHMATQIAVTPTLKGEQAKYILEQLKNQPSESARMGAKKIIEMFEKK